MIRHDENDGVVTLAMEHGKVNALDLELLTALDDELDAIERQPPAAIVVRGNGRVFSAGVDLFRVVEGGREYIEEFLPLLSGVLARFLALPRPTIAAVDGDAIAGGCILACAADRRLMISGEARIGIPELGVGVPFPTVPLEIMRRTISDTWLRRLMLGGARLTPEEAMEAGLVDRIVASGSLLDEAVREAGALATIPPPAYALTKRQLVEPVLAAARERGDTEREVVDAWSSEETLDAIRTYLQRVFGRSERSPNEAPPR